VNEGDDRRDLIMRRGDVAGDDQRRTRDRQLPQLSTARETDPLAAVETDPLRDADLSRGQEEAAVDQSS